MTEPLTRVLVSLTFSVPGMHVAQVEAFLHDLDDLGIKWNMTMDNAPSAEVLAALPDHIREQLAHK
jgi:hypothetical protein